MPSLLSSESILLGVGLTVSSVLVSWYLRQWRTGSDDNIAKRSRKSTSVNIGAIFGMDVGGTLTKIVYYEANRESLACASFDAGTLVASSAAVGSGGVVGGDLPARGSSDNLLQLGQPDHQAALQQLYMYMDNSRASNSYGVVTSDDDLSVYSSMLEGRIHFLHFETRNMDQVVSYLSSSALIDAIQSIGCTGGGAHKYAEQFSRMLDITINKSDELSALIRGMHFALNNFPDECYTYRSISTPPATDAPSAAAETANRAKPETESTKSLRWHRDSKEFTERVQINVKTLSKFPYLLVNIGSGVSILKVTSPGQFERVSGTSLGGGTYWGLCRLLTKCATFEDVIDLAESGDSAKVDMLVRDIYGGDYSGMLSGSMVASSFGKLVTKENPLDDVKEEDLALALLMMLTNNIGQVSYLNAKLHQCSRIFFVGTFLRHNQISCRRLAFAINFWSKGEMEAIFLTHEGYFGALGTFLSSAFGDDVDRVISLHNDYNYRGAAESKVSPETASVASSVTAVPVGSGVQQPPKRHNSFDHSSPRTKTKRTSTVTAAYRASSLKKVKEYFKSLSVAGGVEGQKKSASLSSMPATGGHGSPSVVLGDSRSATGSQSPRFDYDEDNDGITNAHEQSHSSARTPSNESHNIIVGRDDGIGRAFSPSDSSRWSRMRSISEDAVVRGTNPSKGN